MADEEEVQNSNLLPSGEENLISLEGTSQSHELSPHEAHRSDGEEVNHDNHGGHGDQSPHEEGEGENTEDVGANKRRRTTTGSVDAGYCGACDEPGHHESDCPQKGFQVNRDELCPALLRCFTTHGALHRDQDFDGRLPNNETRLHFWPDTTPREIFTMLKNKSSLYRGRDVEVSVGVVYLARDGRHLVRHLFDFHSGRQNSSITFAEYGVEPGDFLSIAITKQGVVDGDRNRKSGGGHRKRRDRHHSGHRDRDHRRSDRSNHSFDRRDYRPDDRSHRDRDHPSRSHEYDRNDRGRNHRR